jgi:hypothetical protein
MDLHVIPLQKWIQFHAVCTNKGALAAESHEQWPLLIITAKRRPSCALLSQKERLLRTQTPPPVQPS